MDEAIFVDLRNALAALYSSEQSIRRIIDDSEISVVNIVLISTPIDNWHSVIKEARRVDRVEALLAVVYREYSNNEKFRKVYDAYYKAKSFNTFRQLPQKAHASFSKDEGLNSNEYDYSKKGEKTSNLNNPLSGSADVVKKWFFKELHPKEQSLLLTTALFEGMDRQKLVQVVLDIEQILSIAN